MNTEKILEFDQIRKQWIGYALTRSAAEKIASMTYYLSESELRKNLQDTTDARNMIETCGMPPLVSVDKAKESIARAVKDGCLTPGQLERIGNLLTAVRRLRDYLDKGRQYGNPLAWYGQNLDALDGLRQEIAGQIRGGEVDDHASRQLQQIRNEMAGTREKMKQKAEQTMRIQKAYMADQFCTVRSGHICIPVKKEYKGKVQGSVIDRSSTGNTLFIEPVSAAKMQETLQMLELEEENEVSRILYTLTALAADQAPVMEEDIRMIEKLDFIFSKAKLSVEMDASEPKINLERRIWLKNARHPFMEKEKCVPLQFEIGKEADGIVITGPNTGGKTAAIKTVALNCYLAQCGLHVACEEADICMNSSFLCDIGDGQNLTENLSTFSAHIKNVLEIVDNVNPDSLVVMDELGSGTDPTEGMGIAVSILDELRKSGCLFLVTTHYPEVKEYAERTERIRNARMEFDKQTLQPTYRMVIGEAGESCAFYIAQKLGMPRRMLEMAWQAAYGADAVDLCRAAGHGQTGRESMGIDSLHREDMGRGKMDMEHLGNGRMEGQLESKRTKTAPKIKKAKKRAGSAGLSEKFHIGDSVMILPDKKIGIVFTPVNEKGVLRVQLPDKKIWINHKRVRLLAAAADMYPDDYDFSIIFDTARNRKIRHDMARKYTEEVIESR